MRFNRESLGKLKEAELRREVIIPLLVKQGWRDVKEWHGGATELGKDIVAWKSDDVGTRENLVVVAKAGKLSGTAAKEVSRQVQQAFGWDFNDPVTKEPQKTHRVWVITNGAIPIASSDSIQAATDPVAWRFTRLVDGDKLFEEWSEYFPVTLIDALEKSQQGLASLGFKYKPEILISEQGRQLHISERYPGQLEIEPIEFQVSVTSPLAGSDQIEQLEKSFRDGTAADFTTSGENIKLPDEIIRMIEETLGVAVDDLSGDWRVEMSAAEHPDRLPIRLEFYETDSEPLILPYIDLRATNIGMERATFSNKDRSFPIHVTMIVDFAHQTIDLNFERSDEPIASTLYFLLARIIDRISSKTSTAHIFHADKEIRISSLQGISRRKSKISPKFFAMLEDLANIQKRLNIPIMIPLEIEDNSDVQAISILRTLLRKNVLPRHWTRLSLLGNDEFTETRFEELFREDLPVPITDIAQESVTLFGTELPLGTVKRTYHSARLDNRDQVIEALKAKNPHIELHFVPGDDDSFSTEFLDWLSES